jgi:type 2 lantibiotic biosynthesis protein LanM
MLYRKNEVRFGNRQIGDKNLFRRKWIMVLKKSMDEILRKAIFPGEAVAIKENEDTPFQEWLQLLNRAIQIAELDLFLEERTQLAKQSDEIPFQEILAVFIFAGMEELFHRNTSGLFGLTQNAVPSMQKSLQKTLVKIAAETLYVEFCAKNIHYIRKFLGQDCDLKADDHSATEYKEFVNMMLHGGLTAFFLEYPVLARHLSATVCRWLTFMSELNFFLKKDYEEISRFFFAGSVPGKVLSMDLNLSDQHNENKTVVKVTFENRKSILFKPRNLGAEKAYYSLLGFFNAKSRKFSQRMLKILDCDTYGWMEFAEQRACDSVDQVNNYFRHAGALLSIVYVFGGTDFHLENVIASGEKPLLVDLEMLINNKEVNGKWRLVMDDVLENQGSVLSTGILPILHRTQSGNFLDLGGLGGHMEYETTLKEAVWKNCNTDYMSVEFQYIRSKDLPCKNAVMLDGVVMEAANFMDEILEGFEDMYQLFFRCKEEILQDDGIIALFSHQILRYVHRETRDYHQIIRHSLQRKFMHHGTDWSLAINKALSGIDNGIEINQQFLTYEYQAICKLDVPIINYSSDSKDMRLSQGIIIREFFNRTAFDVLKENIRNMNMEDMYMQIQEIKCSYRIWTAMKTENTLVDQSQVLLKAKPLLKSDFFSTEAEKIAERILAERIESKQSINWPQLTARDARTYVINLMGAGLYAGKAGIAVFLAAMGKLSGKREYCDLARKIIKNLTGCFAYRHSDSLPTTMNLGIGAGIGGMLYAAVLTGTLLEDDALYQEVTAIIPLINNEIIKNDDILDIIGGCSGMILSLLAVYRATKKEVSLFTAIRCGFQLLNKRAKGKNGFRAWKHNKILAVDEQPLCGFAHGASGMAYALLRLYKFTGIKEFLDAAEEAILYEDSFLNENTGPWPDLRKAYAESDRGLYNAWCHGAAGILITRMEALPFLKKELLESDIERALQIILNTSSGSDHVCCGTYGRADVLLTAAQKLSNTNLKEQALQLLSVTPSPNLKYNFSFFSGLSGMGYTLLRLSNERLPSVLAFES